MDEMRMTLTLTLCAVFGCNLGAADVQPPKQELSPACQSQKTKAKLDVKNCEERCPDGGRCCPIDRCGTRDLDKWRAVVTSCGDTWSPLWPESTTGVESEECNLWRYKQTEAANEPDGGSQ